MREWMPMIAEHTRRMAEEFRPFDYGRYEFRFDREGGKVQFLEVNLNANLWSQKVYGRSAKAGRTQPGAADRDHPCESLRRHGLLERGRRCELHRCARGTPIRLSRRR